MTFEKGLPLVEIRGLMKRFGARIVLHGIDLEVPRAAVTAVIGPNGAGKTTLNKALLGLVRPDTGMIAFDGVDTARRIDHRGRIGYMPQTPRYPDTFSPNDVLQLLSDLRGPATVRDEELVEAFGLSAFLEQPARSLSGGQRQRLNAAAAFLFSPDLLLLDEPTAGLDPVASGVLKDKIRAVRDAGRAVMITSHILSELEELADRVVFLHEGSVCFAGSLVELRTCTGAATLERAIATLMRGDLTTGAHS
jgi:Cu-processing system ATP-binding protein